MFLGHFKLPVVMPSVVMTAAVYWHVEVFWGDSDQTLYILEILDHLHRSYNHFLFHGESFVATVSALNQNSEFSPFTIMKSSRFFKPASRKTQK